MDLWRGTLSPRKVDVLVRGLPADSNFRRAVAKDEPPYEYTDLVLRDLINVVQAQTWVIANRGQEKHNQSKWPEPYQLPGLATETSKKKKNITAEALKEHQRRTQRS